MRSRTQLLLLAALLTAVALFARLYRLDVLAFYGDEDTTGFPARALAEGGEARFPSGMAYRRALCMTYANAAWARALGTTRELPYRLTAALLGALTIPIVFLWSRRWLGTAAALLLGLLLALSLLHLSHSREARMYSGFLLFFTCTAFASWRWSETGRWRDWLLVVAMFGATAAMHHGAVLVAPLIAAPVVLRRDTKVHPLLPIATAAGLLFCEHLLSGWVNAPYQSLAPAKAPLRPDASFLAGPLNLALVGLGAAVGVAAAWRGRPEPDQGLGAWLRLASRLVLAGAAGALAFGGQVFGAACALALFLLVHDGDRRRLWRATWPFAGACALVLAGRVGLAVASHGAAGGLRTAFAWPYPTAIWYGQPFPGVYALMAAAIAWVSLSRPREETAFLRYCALAFFVPTLVVGAAHRYAPLRYVIGAYPFIVILAAAALAAILRRAVRREILVGAVGALIVASGVLGGHGVPQTWSLLDLDYGDPLDEMTFTYRFYPDNESTGRYVAANRRPGDRVVAEDMIAQRWYAGPIDFWLSRAEATPNFLYRDEDGVVRDIYVSSRALEEGDLPLLAPRPESRVWLITSGETSYRRETFLSPEQLQWVADVEKRHRPVFVGRDGASKVYLLEAAR